MKIKRVWFVSHYSMPPEYEMRVKTLRYAHYLGLKGIDCTIFAASTLHNTDIDLITDGSLYIERQYDDLKYVHIRCMRYTKTDLRRIINMEQFGYRFLKVAERFDPPDVIVSDTYCISYEPIYRYCKKRGIPFVTGLGENGNIMLKNLSPYCQHLLIFLSSRIRRDLAISMCHLQFQTETRCRGDYQQ